MKILWCWRCKMENPMLDEEEYATAANLYKEGFRSIKKGSREVRLQRLLDYYFEVTGYKETEANAIMHHRIAQYGPPCENCGKPYRTPIAAFCAACGNNRMTPQISTDHK